MGAYVQWLPGCKLNIDWFIKKHNNEAGQEDRGVRCVTLNDMKSKTIDARR